jgi:glycerol-3-phosphate dehydrogenase (NAD+)
MLKAKNLESEFPLFTQIHKICINEAAPETIIDAMRNHAAV